MKMCAVAAAEDGAGLWPHDFVFWVHAFPGPKSGTWGTRHRSLVNDGAGTKNVQPREGHLTARRAFQAALTGQHGIYACFPGVSLRFTPGYFPALPTGGSRWEAHAGGSMWEMSRWLSKADSMSMGSW